ncbi:MAG TPA: type IV pilus secretin PilQ [Pyrinomonadaceae bacterium]|jgi:type IV pilus assembly protein PilQ|nr:type IV pilus secretin PilQ [Pyrinomonadaceae bacterium]
MTYRKHPTLAVALKSTLVLFIVCLLSTFAQASGTGAPVATALRASFNGDATRIIIAGTAPMAYAVRRPDAHTLVVELPGVDASKLAPIYNVASPLVANLKVERPADRSGAARLRLSLRAPVRERSHMDANELVLELTPDRSGAGAEANARTANAPASTGVVQQPTPVPPTRPTTQNPSGITSATSANTTQQSDQGRQYGQAGFVGEPINLNVVNADIRDILNYITEQYGVNFVIDKSVREVPVTVNVTEVPWNVALDSILQANRLGIVTTGNILRVATADVISAEAVAQARIQEARLNSAQLVTEFVRLNYARAVGTLAGAAGSTGQFAGGKSGSSYSGGSGGDATGGGGDQGILPIISRRLSRRGSVEVDGRSNTLIITDVKENIDAIRQLVMLLDQPEPQVEIETRIVVATRNFSRDLGVQLSAGVLGSRGALGNFSTLPSTSGSGGEGGGGGTGGTVRTGPNPFGVFGGLDGSTQPTPSLAATAANTVIGLTTGIFGTAQISALITAAESRGQAKVVATPRVTALNNRPAQIESGSQIPVVTPQSGGGGSGGGTVFTTTFVSVPLRLSVTPQITDAGTVILRIVAENNTVNLSLTNTLGTPGIDTQRMQSEVLVPDGGTTVVGGVLNDREADVQNRTPGLASVPVLGNLFKRKAVRRDTDEILFFITPRIYRPDYQGRPTAGSVGTGTRTTTIPQPVPLGNPPTNTPSPFSQPTGQPAQPLTTSEPAGNPPARQDDSGARP